MLHLSILLQIFRSVHIKYSSKGNCIRCEADLTAEQQLHAASEGRVQWRSESVAQRYQGVSMVASPGSWSEWALFPEVLKHHHKASWGQEVRQALLSRWLCFRVGGKNGWEALFLPCEVLCCLLLTSSNGQGTVWSMVYSLSIWFVHPIDVFSALAPKLWPSTEMWF